MMTVWNVVTQTDDAVGRTLSLIVGMILGYFMGCVRKTMIYAKQTRNEVRTLHAELKRIERKIEKFHPEVKDES